MINLKCEISPLTIPRKPRPGSGAQKWSKKAQNDQKLGICPQTQVIGESILDFSQYRL